MRLLAAPGVKQLVGAQPRSSVDSPASPLAVAPFRARYAVSSARAWAEPKFSRSKVDSAGAVLAMADPSTSTELGSGAMATLNNWRAAHGFPLNSVQTTLRSRTKAVDRDGLVVQRQKSLPSILAKLRRSKGMRLTQMQDIAGCRAVVSNLRQIYRLRDVYIRDPLSHSLKLPVDYIRKPQPSGYRSVHLLVKFQSWQRPRFNKLLVEIQVRSTLQHTWATAVEAADLFLGSDLKQGNGPPEWQRLFALISGAFAFKEQTEPVPNTPGTLAALRIAISEAASRVDLLSTLETWSRMIATIEQAARRDRHYFIIESRPAQRHAKVYSFREDDLDLATDVFFALEAAAHHATPATKVVLVSANSLRALRAGYSGYFADTQRFKDEVGELLLPSYWH
jgi:hypothetical protein